MWWGRQGQTWAIMQVGKLGKPEVRVERVRKGISQGCGRRAGGGSAASTFFLSERKTVSNKGIPEGIKRQTMGGDRSIFEQVISRSLKSTTKQIGLP
jgi:hypothetical protein